MKYIILLITMSFYRLPTLNNLPKKENNCMNWAVQKWLKVIFIHFWPYNKIQLQITNLEFYITTPPAWPPPPAWPSSWRGRRRGRTRRRRGGRRPPGRRRCGSCAWPRTADPPAGDPLSRRCLCNGNGIVEQLVLEGGFREGFYKISSSANANILCCFRQCFALLL